MDLYIHTLTGTAFELRVSPFETVMSIKAKIQRLEGIPISQQHLIWRSVELIDDFCLHDYNICDGATLQLVLAMRGGPINTRRVPMEDPSLQEMAEYMEANQDEIWDRLPKDNRQVTLLVFRDGDQLNFFRVVDRGDGTLTPLSDSLSGASMYNLYDEEEDDSQKPVSQETIKENKVTMNKMKLLRHKLRSQKVTKPDIIPQPPPAAEKPKNGAVSARRRLHLSEATHKRSNPSVMNAKKTDKSHSKTHIPHPPPPLEANEAKAEVETKGKGPLPPINTKKGKQIDVSDFFVSSQEPKVVTSFNNRSSLTRSAFKEGRRSISEFVKDAKEIKPLGSISKPSTRNNRTSSPQYGGDPHSSPHILRPNRIPEEYLQGNYRSDISSGSAGITRLKESETPDKLYHGIRMGSSSYKHQHKNSVTPPHHLPPVKTHPPQLVQSKKKTRCFFCSKKTGLATTFQCRCGNTFCATHRYAEVHGCTYDYKNEGRKLIEQNNPVVAAPKLPKI